MPRRDSPHHQLLKAYHEELGYDPPSWGKEQKAAQLLLDGGYAIEDVLDCYRHKKADTFWGDRHLSLMVVHQDIGAYLTWRRHQGGAGAVPFGMSQEELAAQEEAYRRVWAREEWE